jgi:putative flippase GtrA
MVSSFVLNRSWTFADRDHRGALAVQATRFLAVSLSALALSTTPVAVAASQIGPLGAKLASIPFAYLWSYQLGRHFVFKRETG